MGNRRWGAGVISGGFSATLKLVSKKLALYESFIRRR